MSSNAFHQCYYHITWATKKRLPMITEGVLPFLLQCIEENCPKRGGILYACNACPTMFISVSACRRQPPSLPLLDK
jgi:REP element-mobilizing transposase RayT